MKYFFALLLLGSLTANAQKEEENVKNAYSGTL